MTDEHNTTEIDTAYFDDIDDHIAALLMIVAEENSEREAALEDRIAYLKERKASGDIWVDNDITSSRDAWKTLATYTEAEALAQQREWDA